ADKASLSMGLARTAVLIEQARGEVINALLFDNGDRLQGNPLGDFIAKEKGLKDGDVHPLYKAMNMLEYDAGNIGNHEFNYGLDFLNRTLQDANFPTISANVFIEDGDGDPTNDKNYFEPYVILDRVLEATDGSKQAIKVGVIGFVPPQIMQWDKSNLEGQVNARDIVETAERFIPEMRRAGADIIIAVPHSGLSAETRMGMDENAAYYLSSVEGIDAILSGHAHLVFPSKRFEGLPGVDVAKGTINGVPTVMPGFWGSHLGIVDLELTVDDAGAWRVVSGTGSVRAIMKRDENRKKIALVEPDPRFIEAVREEHEGTIAFMRRGVGEITAPINSYFALVQDDPSIQIVTDAQMRYVKRLLEGTEYDGLPVLSAGAPFKAGGRGGPEYYTDIAVGEIALKNVSDLYIYPNTLRAVTLTGAQVREWLEMSAGAFNQIDPAVTDEQPLLNPGFPSFNYDVIDGVSYRIDVTQPARYNNAGEVVVAESHRIVDLQFDGKPIDPKQLFVVATNNYRASGGGNFPGLTGDNIIIVAPDTNRDVLANYIFDLKTLDPSADGNWSFAPISGDVIVTFTSGPKAAETLGDDSLIRTAGAAEDGFAKYRLLFDKPES
ncbi:MAG: bifunctional 2',3'-cyclic-nucleotide 2'-phosphodiesterase/3'-nucleotidase, partial [Proteobacteria bacterium]|nr:bifunctional 2',3'-cyclic-nucleotide 2'-phosphodiesterase/3'-nucleotidase [Pseudomonadota bacterium]